MTRVTLWRGDTIAPLVWFCQDYTVSVDRARRLSKKYCGTMHLDDFGNFVVDATEFFTEDATLEREA